MNEYHVIGIMSGSSLDGLDVCYARFTSEEDSWGYKVLFSKTLDIPGDLTQSLRNADKLSSLELFKLDANYGQWIGKEIISIIGKEKLEPDLIGIHGHTVFHEPSENISVQIGSGLMISDITKVPVVDNFRIADIIKGGQGAPLVAVGEHYLLKEYAGFVNLGGIANIAIHDKNVLAWDIAPCNQILNHFAQKLGLGYDKSGELAKSGNFENEWFQNISELEFFKLKPPKSLSNQWRENILDFNSPQPRNALHTYCHFLADHISSDLLGHLPKGSKVLFTGGGTLNDFLIQEIKKRLDTKLKVVIPAESLINYKEALIFGFLGLLRKLEKVNVFSTVTGASTDSVAGNLYLIR